MRVDFEKYNEFLTGFSRDIGHVIICCTTVPGRLRENCLWQKSLLQVLTQQTQRFCLTRKDCCKQSWDFPGLGGHKPTNEGRFLQERSDKVSHGEVDLDQKFLMPVWDKQKRKGISVYNVWTYVPCKPFLLEMPTTVAPKINTSW